MPKDNNRLDLNADLEKLSGDFLKDVEAATKEVKARKQADAEKDRRNAVRKKDKRTSTIIVAVATVVLMFVAYFAVAARQPEAASTVQYSAPQRLNPPIASRSGNTAGQRPTAPRLAPPATAQNTQPQPPPNEYVNEPM